MVMKKRFIRALEKENTSTVPIWLMRQAGRYLPEYREVRKQVGSFLGLCYNSSLATEVTLQPIRRFGFDAAILFSDILVVPHALGVDVRFDEGGPLLNPIDFRKPVPALNEKEFLSNLSPVFETVSNLSQQLPKETALIGFSGSPWTLACYMVEGKGSKAFDNVRIATYQHPEAFDQLISTLTDAVTIYIAEQISQGAEVIQLFDSWSGVVSAEGFEHYVVQPTKKIVSKLKAIAPDIPIIGFPKGAGIHYTHYIEETGIDAIGIDYTLPPVWIKKQFGNKVAIQGNLDPAVLLSSKEKIKDEALKLLDQLANKAYIMNLGHGILPTTPPEHVEFLINTVRNYVFVD